MSKTLIDKMQHRT